MGEKNVIGATLKTPVVKVRCGDCLFFNRMSTFKEPCNKLGILTKSDPCSRFVTDIFQIFPQEGESTVLKSFSSKMVKRFQPWSYWGSYLSPICSGLPQWH